MSESETELHFDLAFLPAWAEESDAQNRRAKYVGEAAPTDGRWHERGSRRPRPRDRTGEPSRPQGGSPRESRRSDDRRRPQDLPRREEPAPKPLPDLTVAFKPDDIGVDSLARQIKITGRAYPLFDIAQMILQKPERHLVIINVEKKPDVQVIQPLFLCALDETLWLSEEEAIHYVLEKHFTTFYQSERTQVDPPKGTYTFVAQCGMSGVILGPPNYHDYQNQLRKLHADRFSRMPFEAFKSRVKIVRDEAVVKKWIEDQSWKTEYTCLNLPEPLKLGSRAEVEAHFRATHLLNIISQVESYTLTGTAARNLRSAGLARLLRSAWEDQRRFPLQIATVLSQQFASRGLQFFKVNRTVTHVSVARPHYLDLEAVPVSEGVRRIVKFIEATPKCTRRRLLEALAPSASSTDAAESAAIEEPAEASPEATAVIGDLHWLIHQGHVTEFANSILEVVKKSAPRKKVFQDGGAAARFASGETASTQRQLPPNVLREPSPAANETSRGIDLTLHNEVGRAARYIHSQFGADEVWQLINKLIWEMLQIRSDRTLRLSDVDEIAAKGNVSSDQVLSVLTLLSSKPDGFFERRYIRANGGGAIVSNEEVIAMIRAYSKRHSLAAEEWKEWASKVLVEWHVVESKPEMRSPD